MVILLGYLVIKGFKVKKRKISLKEGIFILLGLLLLYSLAGDLLRYLTPVNLYHFVRKNAHSFIYLVLGILRTRAFKRSDYKDWKSAALALALCALYVFKDEWHQTFVPVRGGLLSDVRIDGLGASVGILIQNLFSKRKENNEKNLFRLKKDALSAETNCKVD